MAAIAISTQALASAIHTNVMLPGDPPLTITVPGGRIVTVIHYLSNGNGNSTLTVSKDGKSTPILFPVDISANQNGIQRDLVIAGPATVTVTIGSPVMAPIVVTYRLDPNQ